MIKVYGLRNPSTCQKAIAWLADNKVAHSFSDVKDNPVTAKQVAKWSAAVGGWEKLINRAGYTWRGLPSLRRRPRRPMPRRWQSGTPL